MMMFGHNLLLSYRNFKRFKVSFFINLMGLSTGLACSLMIYLWISDELKMDSYSAMNDRLYQVMRNEPALNAVKTEEYTPGPLAPTLKAEMPEVEYAVAAVPPSAIYNGVLSFGNRNTHASPQFADKSFFDVFSYHFIEGNQHTAVQDKNSVAISEAMALKLFHTSKDVTGKVVKFENDYFNGQYIVSGVFIPPSNLSQPFDILFNYQLYLERRPEIKEWTNGGPSTFVIIKHGTDIHHFNQKISRLLQKKRQGSRETLFIQKYSERYLYGSYENGQPAGGRIVYVRLFLIIALFILGIACINFMNLFTAKASVRMKEVGIRKVMGARRGSLILQFMGESMLLSFLSLFVALLAIEVLLPKFNQITGKLLALDVNAETMLALTGITVLTGLVSGSYPSLYLSGFNPAMALKGKLKNTAGALLIRKGLVVFQFIISILLMISVFVVYHQIQFIRTKNLGYDKEHIISFAKEGKLENNYSAFISQLKTIPGVINASYMYGNLAGEISSRSGGFSWEGQATSHSQFNYLDVDYGFIETLGLELKSGRTFSGDFGADSAAVIFNEAAIKAMGIKDPVGKTVNFYGKRQIIGVVKDFHFESLFEKVKPFFFKIEYEKGGNIVVRIKSGTEKSTVSHIEKIYHKFNRGFPFSYKFLEEDYQSQYTAENRIALLSRYFAGIAVLISCLGLFGLAAFTVERRSKEIAIRKVLGCSESGVLYLLSAYFIGVIAPAIVIAFPLAYILAKNWLNSFAYKISLEWWHFAGAGMIAILVACFSVGIQLIKVARSNPAFSLKE
jgi:putative ABC transport system permease protein